MTALHDSPAAANLERRTWDAESIQRGPLFPSHASRPRRAARRAQAIAPGLALALAVAAAATVVGQYVPLIGSAVPGAVIGAVIAIVVKPGARFGPGVKWASTFILQCSVVLLGAQLSIAEAARVGVSSLPVMLGTLAICLAAAWLYGRLLGVPGDLRTLIGVGTGICGGSAIAAVSPVIEAASADIAYAISTIFLFNIAAVLVFPLLGHALGMSQQSFGLFAGTAVNDTSSVVATATTYGTAATSHAVVVKLVRTLMIIPICLGLATLTARKQRGPVIATAPAGAARDGAADAPVSPAALASARMSPRRAIKLVPWFLIGFVLVAAVNSCGIIPAGAHSPLEHASVFLVSVALSAIGLSTNVAALGKAGARPLILGAVLWITVATASLGLQALTGTL
ncbi:MAG TPA: putative sulfate exporter family transporter [Streptosporangiaceae bacterium]|jgi:uncharacterized integral membrane protein (TIGR00698 family)